MSEQCPQCGRPDGVVRAAEAQVPELAPPPLPPVPGKAGKRLRPWALTVIVVLAVLAALALTSESGRDLSDYDAAYRLGYRLGWTVWLLPVPLIWYFGRRVAPETAGYEAAQAVFARRMRVWEHARFCRDCRVAFWAAGVLRPDFPASPAVPPHDFPLVVVTMAERAYGNTYAQHS